MRKPVNVILTCAFFVLFSSSLFGDVKLPSIVSDGMVLQRNVELKIWGWAEPGEKVTVSFKGEKNSSTTDFNGKWLVKLKSMKAGGPYDMEIVGNNAITLSDILIGDVWIASGQSNMTHYFGRHQERYAKEIAESANTEIRQFRVPTTAVITGPAEDKEGLEWKVSTPENLLEFTVIGYFHAKKLYDKYNVPMGIINTCVGGTRIEAWTSEEGFKEFPDILKTIERNKDTEYVNRINAEAKADRDSDGPRKSVDKGMTGDVKWFDPAYEPLNWKRINIPGYWEDQGLRNLNGVVWYRREIEIPEAMIGVEVDVKLGRIRNADVFYVNGVRCGGVTYEYPQREYTIPADVLKPGKNLFVVRVTNGGGKGGFIPDKPYHLTAAGHTIDLKGDWQYKVGEAYSPPSRQYKRGINAQSQPASLYNGMIAPFINYGIRGILWYQGESNSGNPEAYRKLQPNLIKDWRDRWQLGDIVFLIAQLPNYMDVDYLPAESNWALMREIQMDAALNNSNTGTGINIDLGEWNDIHPGNKKPVGERLALLAMNLSYGENDMVVSGPVYKSQKIRGNKITLSFNHVGSGLMSNNGEALAHFAIAGDDKKFVWGTAVIKNGKVVVSHEDISKPKYIRYAWADNPDFANLYNKEGLPASPFRTDR